MGYDPLGRCVKRWVGTSGLQTSNPATYLYYDGWNLIQEGSSSTATRQYVHGARVDEILLHRDLSAGASYYAHYDARTHCIALSNAAIPGVLVEQYTYDAFGKTYVCTPTGVSLNTGSTPASSPLGNRFLFTGREWISDWGVYDYRHRHYHPELGRFLQPDPKHFGAGDYNLYRYCHNDPINKADPDGLDIWIINSPDSAGGFGHNAMIIGQPDGSRFTYHSFQPATKNSPVGKGRYDEPPAFATKEDAFRFAQKEHYTRYLQFKSEEKQDEDARTAARSFKDKTYAVVGSNNCDDMCDRASVAAKIGYRETLTPNGSIDALKARANSSGSIDRLTNPPDKDKDYSHPISAPKDQWR